MLSWAVIILISLATIFSAYHSGIHITDTDIFFFSISICIIIRTFHNSPWKKIASSPSLNELQLANPSVDFSTPVAFVKSVAVGGGTFVAASAANATGFGVFMASAQVLGAMGVSFTGIHLSMSFLGFMLNPVVFTTLSVGAGAIALIKSIKTGDKLLEEAVGAASCSDWNKAYQCVHQALKKVIFKPSVEMWSVWSNYIFGELDKRQRELSQLDQQCMQLTKNPARSQHDGSIVGFTVSIPIVIIALTLNAGCFSVASIMLACSLFSAERFLSVPMHHIVTRSPILQSEITAIKQIMSITP
jgi:hypothetical protein